MRQATIVSARDDTLVGAFTFEDLVALTVSKPLLGLKAGAYTRPLLSSTSAVSGD